ncbi:MAG: hypothetical protein R3321_04695 [Nitrososphaeraceae archaeon]|nr:hypothetical protein [Nitrososphaeraceae archaeon]
MSQIYFDVEFIEKDVIEIDLIERELVQVSLNVVDIVQGNNKNTFSDLDDTDFQNLQNGQFAKYNEVTKKWENVTLDVIISDNSVYNENPTKLSSTQFQTLNDFVAGTLRVFLNGIKEKYVTENSPDKFTFAEPTIVGDIIEVHYIKDV